MAVEAVAWPDPPTQTDLNDGGQAYLMGALFALGDDAPCPGVEWRVPDTVSDPPNGGHYAALWRESDEARLAIVQFTPTPGVKQQIAFDAPVDLLASESYVATVYTVHYVFTAGAGNFPVDSFSGLIVSTTGKLGISSAGGTVVPYPDASPNSIYHIGPLIGTLSDEPEEHFTSGTAPATASATAIRQTVRVTAGVAAALSAARQAVSSARLTAGVARATATASASRTTARTTAGSARAVAAGGTYTPLVGPGPLLRTTSRPVLLGSTSRKGYPRTVTSTTIAK